MLEAAGPVDGVLRFFATRGGRRIVLVEPLPHRAGDRAAGDRPLRAQPRHRRPEDALLRRQHARAAARAGAGLRRRAARHAARPRARGGDVELLLGPRRACCARRRWRTGSSARSPATRLIEDAGAVEEPTHAGHAAGRGGGVPGLIGSRGAAGRRRSTSCSSPRRPGRSRCERTRRCGRRSSVSSVRRCARRGLPPH